MIKKSPVINVLLITIPLTILILIVFFLIVHKQINEQTNTIALLEEELANTQEELQYYKEAYTITLQDIRQLSTHYGGEERYDEIAQEFRQREIGQAHQILEPQTYVLANPAIWVSYYEQDIIRTNCLNTVNVNAITNDVLFVLNVAGEGDLSIYVDANRLVRHTINSTQEIPFTINLPRGQHALDLITTTGITLNKLTIETQEISLDNIVANKGEQWQVFNCEEYEQNNFLEGPGALRLLIKT